MAILNKSENNEIIFLSYNSTGFNHQRADFLANLTDILGCERCCILDRFPKWFLFSYNLLLSAMLWGLLFYEEK